MRTCVVLCLISACNNTMQNPEVDAGMDAGRAVRTDAGREVDSGGDDAGMSPETDAGMVIETDAGMTDGGMGPDPDAGMMIEIDAGMMIEIDAGMMVMTDGGTDAGGPMCTRPEPPSPIVGCNPTDGIECDGDWAGRCSPACSASQCCSPQNNRFMCVPRNLDGMCPAADLWVDAARLAPRITTDTFSERSCELAEGCIGAAGTRRLLRFNTWTPNTGGADMFLGVPSASSYFEYSSCHRHYHFNTYAEYELLSADGNCVAANGHKQAFCLLDYYDYPCDSDPSTPAGPCSLINGARGAYTCGNQGIRRNAQDVYYDGLDCQWIDITGVPAGDYIVRIRINTEHILNESNYDNNEVRVPVRID
jgi:hypothetical protein